MYLTRSKKQIWSNEYVDFALLLNNKFTHSYDNYTFKVEKGYGGKPALVLAPHPTRQMGISGTYNSRYLDIRTCDFRPLSVQLQCRANIFPPYYPAHGFRSVPFTHSVHVCPHLCWNERHHCSANLQFAVTVASSIFSFTFIC